MELQEVVEARRLQLQYATEHTAVRGGGGGEGEWEGFGEWKFLGVGLLPWGIVGGEA